MIKFTKWLIDNGFTITSEYDYSDSMKFEKGILKFTLRPEWIKNVLYYTLSVKKNEYEKDGIDLDSRQIFVNPIKTQKEMILRLSKFMLKNN